MKFVLFVEGQTEHNVVPKFLKRWLDPKLPRHVGIQCVRFEGWPELVKDAPDKARLYLSGDDVIAVIALLDLYGPIFYPEDMNTPDKRYKWAKHYLEEKVGQDRFFQFFAVHEVEAWLLSDPSIFPAQVRKQIEKLAEKPELVNNTNPPAKRLNKIYSTQTGKRYKKIVHGNALFAKLKPETAYKKCPYLRELLDTMLKLAKDAMGEGVK